MSETNQESITAISKWVTAKIFRIVTRSITFGEFIKYPFATKNSDYHQERIRAAEPFNHLAVEMSSEFSRQDIEKFTSFVKTSAEKVEKSIKMNFWLTILPAPVSLIAFIALIGSDKAGLQDYLIFGLVTVLYYSFFFFMKAIYYLNRKKIWIAESVCFRALED